MIPRAVFAHYVVGLTFNQSLTQWAHDIALAASASIDGFALNIGARDIHTSTALRNAYDAAAAAGNFSLFLSFDFSAADGWTVESIANLTQRFIDEPAQYKVDGKPVVSTFEGVGFAREWRRVREKVPGGVYFLPDWSSLGPEGVGKKLDLIDGACECRYHHGNATGMVSLTVNQSLLRCVASIRRDEDDHPRGRTVQDSTWRQDVHDGRQSLLLLS